MLDLMRRLLRALERQADHARFRPNAPFYIGPDRTRESIVRVFRAQYIPARLDELVRNELDALLIILAFEIRMWVRSLSLPASRLINLWQEVLVPNELSAELTSLFFNVLLFLTEPKRRGDREALLIINFRDDRLALRTRLNLIDLAEVIEIAERLALFTDEPRVDEQPGEAGELRRALRNDVHLSSGAVERCTVRLPRLRHRYFHDALRTLLGGIFLPTKQIAVARGAAAESRWIQIIVEELLPDGDVNERPLSIVDRIKRVARNNWREFCEVNGFSEGPMIALSFYKEVTAFLASHKTALVVLGVGGSGKTTVIRQIESDDKTSGRTVLVFPLRNRRESWTVSGLLCSALGAPAADEVEVLETLAKAFAQREEQLILVLDGLNEVANGQQVLSLCRSLTETAAILSTSSVDDPTLRGALRVILTSRHETYFGARARLGAELPPNAFHLVTSGIGREPRPYLEILPLTQPEREALFGIYFGDSDEDGAEQAITRATRRDRTFARLLSRPIMVMLAGELYKKGVSIRALRSSSDLIDLVVDYGFERLPSQQRVQDAWSVLDRIFEQRIRLAENDVVKYEDLWAGQPHHESILLALSDLSGMGILKSMAGSIQGIIAFSHDRIEEVVLGRYLNQLDARRISNSDSADWYDRALELSFGMSESKTLYEEALTYHLRDRLTAYLFENGPASALWPRRWASFTEAATRVGQNHQLARVLTRSLLNLCSGPRARELQDRWLTSIIDGVMRASGGVVPLLLAETTIIRLLEGIESLLDEQVPDITVLTSAVLRAVRGYFDNLPLELRCMQVVAESYLAAEDWSRALDYLNRAEQLLSSVDDDRTIERFRRAKGIALRNIGYVRQASDELQAVLISQINRGDAEATRTLPAVIETVRELGNFASGLELIARVEREAGPTARSRDRLRLALWRGILHKNLMQDAIQFRWDAPSGRFIAAPEEFEPHHHLAEEALGKALDIAATDSEDGRLLSDTIQVHSELAETALWYSIARPEHLKEADLRLEEFGKLLTLNPSTEPKVEYHRYCAQRAALERRFSRARTSLERARRLAREHGMKFLEADCDLDWARFIANETERFKPAQIQEARDRLRIVLAYFHDNIGRDSYYPRIVELLLAALNRALENADQGSTLNC
jgi:tetratricopeptide (TPR) repeat protein